MAVVRDATASGLTFWLASWKLLAEECGRLAGDVNREEVNSVWLCALKAGPVGSLPRLIFLGDFEIKDGVGAGAWSCSEFTRPSLFGDSLIACLKGD